MNTCIKIHSTDHFIVNKFHYYTVKCTIDGEVAELCSFNNVEKYIGKIVGCLIYNNYYKINRGHQKLKCIGRVNKASPMDIFLFRKRLGV